MDKTYKIEITGTVYSYNDENGENLDGDRRELASNTTNVIMDDDDQELFEGFDIPANVAWAASVVVSITDAVEPSCSPLPDAIGEHCWLSGSYTDPYEGDNKITETSVRLTGDWTDEDRALVFKKITARYHTG